MALAQEELLSFQLSLVSNALSCTVCLHVCARVCVCVCVCACPYVCVLRQNNVAVLSVSASNSLFQQLLDLQHLSLAGSCREWLKPDAKQV